MENTYTYEKPADEKLYEEMRRKSLEGEPTKRTKKRYKINKKKFIRAIAVMVGLVVSISAGAYTIANKIIALEGNRIGNKVIDEIKDNSIHNTVLDEYRRNVFNEAKHHVNGTTSEWSIDYQMLAENIDEAEDKDLEIYLIYRCFRSENIEDCENQMNQIFKKSDLKYDTFDSYLKARNYDGYADADEFLEDSKQEIIIIGKNDKNNLVIQKTNEAHPKITDIEKGEKSL